MNSIAAGLVKFGCLLGVFVGTLRCDRLVDAGEKILKPAWEWAIPGELPQSILEDSRGKPFLYVALKQGGLLVLRNTGRGLAPEEVARVPVSELGGLDAMHLTQQGDDLLLALGDFFSSKGAHAGLAIVNISNPAKPTVRTVWKSPDLMQGAAIVVANAEIACLGAMSRGMLVFNIRNRDRIELLTSYQPDVNFPRQAPNRIQHPNARGMQLSGETLYLAYDAGGLRIIDLKDPRKPQEVGRYINPGMGQKQQAYNNLYVEGKVAYVAVDYAGIEILDVRDARNVRSLGWWNPFAAETNRNNWFNSPGHVNQIAFDPGKKQVYLSAGDAELLVVDVSTPKRPQLAARVGEPKNGRGTWGVWLGKDQVYLTYITSLIPFRGTWSGIVAVDR
ncbi:MAG: hypothetical protein R3C01_17160 [Planctomycetaceae bacterium]